MAYPIAPEISTSYTAQEQALGDGTLPGQELDVDLAAIRASITALIEFLKTSLRSDGRLNNGTVTKDSLSSSLVIGLDTPTTWATATKYTKSSLVFEGFGMYLCLTPHTSGVFATDLASSRWQLLLDLTPPGGALVAANNLSDVMDVGNARANLGLGSMATGVAGTGAAQFRTNLQNEAFFQPLAAVLTSWAAITRASGFDAFVANPTSANLRALLTDETGTGAALFAGGAMGTPSSLVLTNATGLTTAGIAAGSLTTAAETIEANVSDTQVPTSAAVDAHIPAKLNATGAAPLFGIRAWVNFGATQISGTYARSGTLVTVTMTGHTMQTGNRAQLDFTTGAATDGFYTVTVVDANTFTVVDSVSGATSGNVSRRVFVRAGGNVASMARNGLGDYTINFTDALPDINAAVSGSHGPSGGAVRLQTSAPFTTTSVQVACINLGGTSTEDPGIATVMVVR